MNQIHYSITYKICFSILGGGGCRLESSSSPAAHTTPRSPPTQSTPHPQKQQVTGRYACKAPKLVPLLERVRRLAGAFDSFAIVHVPR